MSFTSHLKVNIQTNLPQIIVQERDPLPNIQEVGLESSLTSHIQIIAGLSYLITSKALDDGTQPFDNFKKVYGEAGV